MIIKLIAGAVIGGLLGYLYHIWRTYGVINKQFILKNKINLLKIIYSPTG